MQVFDHEKLDVYSAAIEFIAWVGEILDGPLVGCRLSAKKHLDEASQSIANNIAEGNGKRSPSDRCRFLDIATGSAMECAACLDGLVARRHLEPNPLELERQCFFESSRGCAVWWSAFSRTGTFEHEHEHDSESRSLI